MEYNGTNFTCPHVYECTQCRRVTKNTSPLIPCRSIHRKRHNRRSSFGISSLSIQTRRRPGLQPPLSPYPFDKGPVFGGKRVELWSFGGIRESAEPVVARHSDFLSFEPVPAPKPSFLRPLGQTADAVDRDRPIPTSCSWFDGVHRLSIGRQRHTEYNRRPVVSSAERDGQKSVPTRRKRRRNSVPLRRNRRWKIKCSRLLCAAATSTAPPGSRRGR